VTIAGARVAVTSGLRPLNPFRDLPAVTSLLAQAFGPELERESMAAARSLRWAARFPVLAWLWYGFDPWYDSRFTGFVWLEDGKVVGNANVAPLRPDGRLWVLSNVAVAEQYRGRGIGGALVEACLERARQSGGERVLLQVWQENRVAHSLYEKRGFEVVGRIWRLTSETLWECAGADAQYAEGWHWRRMASSDLFVLASIAAEMTPRALSILRPPDIDAFRPSLNDRLIDMAAKLGYGRSRCPIVLCEGEQVRGGLVMRSSRGTWQRLFLILSPDAQKLAARWVARTALDMVLASAKRTAICDLPATLPKVREELLACGFGSVGSLLQMELVLT